MRENKLLGWLSLALFIVALGVMAGLFAVAGLGWDKSIEEYLKLKLNANIILLMVSGLGLLAVILGFPAFRTIQGKLALVGGLVLSVVAGCMFAMTAAPGDGSRLEMVRGGGITESNGYWFQAGGLFLQKGSPGVLFGSAKAPDGDRELKYVVIFKHRATGGSSIESPSNISDQGMDRRQITIADGVNIDGKGVRLTLEIEIDSTNNVVKREELTFDGKKIDLSRGRLFLVDLTGGTTTWEQVQVTLPGKPPDPTETKNALELSKRVLSEVPSNSTAVRDFLR